MIKYEGFPKDGGLYTGYNILRDLQVIGFIGVGGRYEKGKNVELTDDEKSAVQCMCEKVYNMPSEYGCLGVGDKPTELFNPQISGVYE